MDGRVPKPRLDPGTILRISEHFLNREHYVDCRQYAQQVFEIDPSFPGVSEILAVVDVLLASKNRLSTEIPHDWYAVMQLDRFSQDSNLITQRFHLLYGLLDPSNNKFPFADKAFDLVCDAWYVLSNPEHRREFDDSLKRLMGDENSKDNLWTVCPYCYYVYEFPRAYLELCLKCPNEKCSKAFTCVEIDRPPFEVLIKGNYICAGFSPLGDQYGRWNPFTPSKKQEAKTSPNTDTFVQISDDDEDQTNREKNVAKQVVRRKKSVAKNTKKVTGVGNRVTKEVFVHRQQPDLTVHSPENDDDDCENNFSFGSVGGPIDPTNVGEVEFHDADGDIFVSLA